jgi:hypothetical protein
MPDQLLAQNVHTLEHSTVCRTVKSKGKAKHTLCVVIAQLRGLMLDVMQENLLVNLHRRFTS